MQYLAPSTGSINMCERSGCFMYDSHYCEYYLTLWFHMKGSSFGFRAGSNHIPINHEQLPYFILFYFWSLICKMGIIVPASLSCYFTYNVLWSVWHSVWLSLSSMLASNNYNSCRPDGHVNKWSISKECCPYANRNHYNLWDKASKEVFGLMPQLGQPLPPTSTHTLKPPAP